MQYGADLVAMQMVPLILLSYGQGRLSMILNLRINISQLEKSKSQAVILM